MSSNPASVQHNTPGREPDSMRLRTSIIRSATAVTVAAIASVVALLVYCQYCQFTAGRMGLHDYGIYFNMLWNTAHGNWFTYLTDQSYLSTHLSFSLVLLAPFFFLWNNPLLLTVIQWLSLVAGILVVWRILALARFPPFLTAALLFLFTAYPYTQASMLCEFHGVHLYYFLIPWLYLCLAFHKRWVWLPLLLLAGLREDAAFIVIPMLVYFAVADRWKSGFLWSLAATAYGILALTALFPWINGITILERRDLLLNPDTIKHSLSSKITQRFLSIFLVFLPAAPLFFLRRRNWIPIVAFPSLLLIMLLASPERHHYCIHRHYSAGVFTCLVLGLIEALRRTTPTPAPSLTPAPAPQPWRLATFFILLTVISHFAWGALPWGIRNPRTVFRKPSPYIPLMLHAVRCIPPEGVLLTDERLAGYLGFRRSVITFKTIRTDPHSPDYILFDMTILNPNRSRTLRPLVAGTAFGVIAFEPPFVVLKQGAPTTRNAEVLAAADATTQTEKPNP